MASSDLARLIDDVKAANGWSDPDLVRNAHERGFDLTKSTISRYRNEAPLISIKGAIIEALAAGLRVPAARVAQAAVLSMGIAIAAEDAPTAGQAILADADLAERDRHVLLATLEGLQSSKPGQR